MGAKESVLLKAGEYSYTVKKKVFLLTLKHVHIFYLKPKIQVWYIKHDIVSFKASDCMFWKPRNEKFKI